MATKKTKPSAKKSPKNLKGKKKRPAAKARIGVQKATVKTRKPRPNQRRAIRATLLDNPTPTPK